MSSLYLLLPLYFASIQSVVTSTAEHLMLLTSTERECTYPIPVVNGSVFSNDTIMNTVEDVCPPWQYCDSEGYCSCGNTPYEFVKCSNQTLSVLNCFCVTYNETSLTSELGQCLLNCQHKRLDSEDRIYRIFSHNASELNEALCGKFNRRGSLCGSCKDGYYPLAYSYNMTCVRCEDTWYNWVEYLVIVYVPLTVFYFIILFFQVNMTSSYLLGFLLYSQVISFPMMCRILVLSYHGNKYYQLGVEIAASFYGLWNLDFFRIANHSTCVRSSFLVLTALDLISGIYPLFLIFMTYIGRQMYDANYRPIRIAMQPVHILRSRFGKTFAIKTSLIDAFSTFFLLSNMKLFNVSYDLLAASKVYVLESTGNLSSSYRLYLNGDVTFFGATHLPFGLLAIAVIILFHVIPALCLFFYPFQVTHKCLAFLPPRCLLLLKTFIESFQGAFKDGTEPGGNTNFKWFSGILFVFKFLLLIFYILSFDVMFFVFALMTLTLISMSITALRPFQEATKHNFLTPSFLLYLSCVYLCLIGGDASTIRSPQLVPYFQVLGIAMGFTPLCYAIVLFLHWGVAKKCRVVGA